MIRLFRSLILHARFAGFARDHGLVHLGRTGDDTPIRGFTAHKGQIDDCVMHGTIGGHEITMLRRSVRHEPMPHEHRGMRHAHVWTVVRVLYHVPGMPHALFMSHDHPRLVEEARFLHRDRSSHVAVSPELDAAFLIYSRPSDADMVRSSLNDAAVSVMINAPSHDYEFDADGVTVYRHGDDPSYRDMAALLKTALALADALEEV